MEHVKSLIENMPRLIQAGMGVHISSAHLANITSRLGALGVVSGAAIRSVIIEDIRSGDRDSIELAATFPVARYVDEILAYAPGGRKHRHAIPLDVPDPVKGALAKRLATIAAYVEVMRAKKGHNGKVGINVMWKCALTALPTIYGAMLAEVDALLCGAGVPMELPDIVGRLRQGQNLEYSPLHGTDTHVSLNVEEDGTAGLLSAMAPPHMMPILSNFAFPKRMLDIWQREYDGARPFAFVLENHKAGGHNAPPRNKTDFTARDDIDDYFARVVDLGLPIYVAGAFEGGGTREDFLKWISKGAYGLQVGSRFALCTDSGMRDDLRTQLVNANAQAPVEVATSYRLSPTGYPLKFVPLENTIGEKEVYEARPRICNRGYLMHSHFETLEDGSTRETYVCPAMPHDQFKRLGGEEEELEGRSCLCNGLLSTAGYYSDIEPPLVTLGASGRLVNKFQTAREVMEEILTPEYVAEMEEKLSRKGELPDDAQHFGRNGKPLDRDGRSNGVPSDASLPIAHESTFTIDESRPVSTTVAGTSVGDDINTQ